MDKKKWTKESENVLRVAVKDSQSLHAAFMTVAEATGRTERAVASHYYKKVKEETPVESADTRKSTIRWSESEEQRLIRQVRVFPQNLRKCFMIVSEETGRTPCAVGAHWYAVTSKRPDVMCFFTASPSHISKNRKNGNGVESNSSIWRRLLRIIHTVIH